MNEPTFGRTRTRRRIESRATLTVPGWHASDSVECGAVRSDARDLVQLYAGRLTACGKLLPDVRSNGDCSAVAFGVARQVGRGTEGHRQAVSEIAQTLPAEAVIEPLPCDMPEIPEMPLQEMEPRRLEWPRLLRLPQPPLVRRLIAACFVVLMMLMLAGGPVFAQQRYRVQDGDTLDSIATEFGVDADAILAASWMANPPNPAPGDVLVIPDPGQSPTAAAEMAAQLEGTSPWVIGAYTVESGDSIEYIAGIYGVDPNDLAKLNGIDDWSTLSVGQRLLIPGESGGAAQTPEDNVGRKGPDSSVWVPRYVQERNLSCEYAAVYIATSSFGNGIPEDVFIDQIPESANPHLGYRGNIDGPWGGYDDYGIYPEPLVPILNNWGFTGDVFYSEGDPSMLINHIDQGHPVLVWLAFQGDTGKVYKDDGRYTVFAGDHVVVVYGYDDDGVYLSDPAVGRYRFFDWDTFLSMWGTMDGMALAVYPM
jgi:LysM repeat protein